MVQNEFTFQSSDQKTAIHAVEWQPEGPVRAVLQISHGVSEHILRYKSLAEYLTERGFAVAGNDHLGHGESVAPNAPRLYFGPKNSWQFVVDDLYACRQILGKYFSGIPYFLLGHSMGSFLARTYLIRYPGTVDGAILMGTGQMSPVLITAAKLLVDREIHKLGEEHGSPLIDKLAFGAYNQRFAPNQTAFDWLSCNPENIERYLADPLCGGDPSLGLFREMLNGMAFISKAKNLKKMNRNLPILFLSGEMDPVGDCGRGVRLAYRSFQRAGVRDVSLKLYPNLRHEILNETCQEIIYGDLLQWLLSRLPKDYSII